jgi:hypothetical protein
MRRNRVLITMSFCLVALAVFAWSQAVRKPGLWEMTTNMTWQQSPIPQGTTMPQGANSPFAPTTHTSQVCLTQAMIDKYGAPMPQSRNGECQISNVVLHPSSMSADWICSGRMAGKGTLESSWTDPDHAKGKVHFVGAIQMGPNTRTIEYTIESSSIYKGPDCGSVLPQPMPKN